MGYDYYCLECSYVYEWLLYSKKYNIKLYRLTYINENLYFYVSMSQRYLVTKIDLPICRIKSIGLLSYLVLGMTHYKSIVFLLSLFISFFCFSLIIFDIKIVGQNKNINSKIVHTLDEYDIHKYSYKKSYEKLNDILFFIKDEYKNDIEYLNLYQQGSMFFVEYISQKKELIYDEKFQNLYAKSDGLIKEIDVESGVIKVKINDYVKKGDILVENYLVSTQNQLSIIPVKAKIYAYTFHTFRADKKIYTKDNSELFYELLLHIRKNIPVSAKIDVEKVLQIQRSHSTISLKMHYTLIEDIAIEGDKSEESH